MLSPCLTYNEIVRHAQSRNSLACTRSALDPVRRCVEAAMRATRAIALRTSVFRARGLTRRRTRARSLASVGPTLTGLQARGSGVSDFLLTRPPDCRGLG